MLNTNSTNRVSNWSLNLNLKFCGRLGGAQNPFMHALLERRSEFHYIEAVITQREHPLTFDCKRRNLAIPEARNPAPWPACLRWNTDHGYYNANPKSEEKSPLDRRGGCFSVFYVAGDQALRFHGGQIIDFKIRFIYFELETATRLNGVRGSIESRLLDITFLPSTELVEIK